MNKIMVVNDEEAIRLLYEDILTEEGYTVFSTDTDSTEDLMETIHEKMPDLILMDILLKKVSGAKIIKEIRNCYSHIQIILLTVFDGIGYGKKYSGADYYITTSFDFDELKQTIKIALSDHKGLNLSGFSSLRKESVGNLC